MIVSNIGQLYLIIVTLIIGVALGLLYDLFKVLRKQGADCAVAVFFEDVLFFLISTVVMFSFYMQFCDGKFRIFPLFSAVAGFAVYKLALGRPIFYLLEKIAAAVRKILSFFIKKTVLPLIKIEKKLVCKALKPLKRLADKIIIFIFKKLLPKLRKKVYNKQKMSKEESEVSYAPSERKNGKKTFFC